MHYHCRAKPFAIKSFTGGYLVSSLGESMNSATKSWLGTGNGPPKSIVVCVVCTCVTLKYLFVFNDVNTVARRCPNMLTGVHFYLFYLVYFGIAICNWHDGTHTHCITSTCMLPHLCPIMTVFFSN